MREFPLPRNEGKRLATLRSLNILDTPPELRFDRITRLAQHLFDVPIALISLIDENRQWFKSRQGLEACERPRDISFCTHALLEDDIFIIPDALQDPRFADNPLVLGEPFIRFYAGYPLAAPDNTKMGTLCIIDCRPRHLSESDLETLRDLGGIAADELNSVNLNAVLTERAEAEQALHESEETFKALAEASFEGISITENGQILEANQNLANMFGYDLSEITCKSILDLVAPEFAKQLLNLNRTGQEGGYEAIGIRKDCSQFPIELYGKSLPYKGRTGQVITVRDITESVRVRKELLSQATRLHDLANLIDLTHDNIIVRDKNDLITFWNKGAEFSYGWTKQEALGKNTTQLLKTRFPLPEDQVYTELFNNGRWEGDLIHTKRDGSLVIVSSRWTLGLDLDGKFQTTFEINNDITLRKEAEEALKVYADEITQKNQELAVARDQAVAASRIKSEFLATMSHEIRTPMNGILGMADILLSTDLDEEQQEFAGIIRDSGEALLSIINDILDFSKIEAGKLTLETIDFDLRQVVEGMADLLGPKAQEKKLSLMTFVAPEIPFKLLGDPGRLRQILLNLTGNAIKFTEQGEIIIRVHHTKTIGEKVKLYFSISDTGIGLSEKARQRLFQSFTQADGSTTRKHGGTGLGLAISKRLAEAMGGEMGVESEKDCGSTFWFTVWLSLAPASDKLPTVDLKPLSPDLRVLAVDDSLSSLEIICKYISSWGLLCDKIESPNEALAMLRRAVEVGNPYDLVIIDLVMPEMDGFALARAIEREPALAATPLILLTVFDERGQGEQALRVGFSAYLVKPLKQSSLFDTVVTVISNKQVKTSIKQANDAPNKDVRKGNSTNQMGVEQIQQGKLILLAEDNLANQKVAQVQLNKLGYQVHTVGTGKEVVEAIAKNESSYNLVLMDCQMPEMDGFNATRTIRRYEATTGRHIPIIAMTANAMEGDRETCIVAGMDDYISKPVNQEKLAKLLQQWT